MQTQLILVLTSIFSFIGGWTLQAQVMFTEVAEEKGINYIYPGNDFQMAGGGVMVIDVNNDGWEDLFQSGGVFESKLWLNDHGKFTDATEQYGLTVLDGFFIQGAIGADYNNDGFQDFIVANYGTGMGRGDKHAPALLKNIEGKRFEMISLEGVVEPGNYASACWGDINNDGYSDIYLTNYVASMGGVSDSNGVEIGYDPICFENKLLLNLAGNGFRECAWEYGVNDQGCGLAASFTDVDADGDVDLMLLNDFGEWTGFGNRYFRNDFPKASFSDLTNEAGFNEKMYGMGIGQGDYDQDGDLDYYITNIGRNFLYRNSSAGFEDQARLLGVDLTFVRDSVRGTSWSGLFFDLDFDGDLDLYVSKGNVATLVPKTVIKDPNRLFLNENGKFVECSAQAGLDDILSHRGAAVFDYDHDGDLDLVSSVIKLPWAAFARLDQRIKLYRNDTPHGNWIGIQLIGEEGVNRDGFGCKVVFNDNGKLTAREVDAGSGQASQSSRILYLGMGSDPVLDEITIYWSNGKKTILKGLKANCLYTVSVDGTVKKINR